MKTIDFVKQTALLLKDPNELASFLFSPDNPLPLSLSVPWSPLSFAHGYPSMILLFSVLEKIFPGEERWDVISHLYVLKVKESIEKIGITNFSLFEGLTGCCFAIESASHEKKRYQKMLEQLNRYLYQKIDNLYLLPLLEKIEMNLPALPRLYDLISGVIGVGVYTLKNLNCQLSINYLTKILNICVSLTRHIKIESYYLPAWYIPAHYLSPLERKIYPKGNFNMGIAHGITGILGFLCLAAFKGVEVKGQKEAIDKSARWIVAQAKQTKKMNYWTVRASLEEEKREEANEITREGWCDGTPGIARVLYLTSIYLNDHQLQQFALDAFTSIFKRIEVNQHFESPTFCHGLAGLLTLTRLMAIDTKISSLQDHAFELEKLVLNFSNPVYPFKFRDKELIADNAFSNQQMNSTYNLKDQIMSIPMLEVDNVGLLGGTSGILLALLSNYSKDLTWTFPFLINKKD